METPSSTEQSENEREQSQVLEQIEALQKRLIELRREAPPQPLNDYTLRTVNEAAETVDVKLSSLFGDGSDLLIIHNMGSGCSYCTLWADEINGILPHLLNRTAVVLSSPESTEKQREFAASRGWNFKMVSGALDMTRDLGFLPEGDWWPGVSALRRNADGTISRVGKDFFGPGDAYCGVWHFLDLLAEGANGWEPDYKYK